MFQHWGLKKQFLTVFLVLITIPTILFGCLIYYQTTKTFKQQAEENTIRRLGKNEENLTSIISGMENMSSYMIYNSDFRTFFTTTKEETHLLQYKQAVEGIKGYFTFQLMTHDYIDSIILKGNDGHSLHVGNTATGNEGDLDREAIVEKGRPTWSNSYEITSDWGGSKKVISLTRVVNDLNHINEPIGLARIRLDESKLYERIEAHTIQQLGNYFVMSQTGEVLLHKNESLVGNPFPDPKVIDLVVNSKKTTMNYKTDETTYLVVKKKIEGTEWVSIAIVNEAEVVKSLYNVRALIVDMILILVFLGVIAFIGFYLSNIKRITELTDQTKQLENGDFTASVKVTSQDEIGILGLRFNKMVKTIKKYINIEYKLKLKQKETELKALQSQIDPHFLYNTLDMIRWTARIENANETGQLIERLAKIFRMNLNMGRMWVKVEEEVAYIQNYLELQKSRMGERLNFGIFYDDQIKQVAILKQVLQPLVENSIRHGFKNLPRQGIITIRCYKVEEELWVDIIDNGWGFSDDFDYEKKGKESGFALKNLQDRLNKAFGDGFGMEQIEYKAGAWIRLKLPIHNYE